MDFQYARKQAAIQEILARITGKSTQLLSYEEVAEKLKLRSRTERGLKTIPIEAIVGSVGRYAEFTRSFLPLRAEDQERWARVKTAFLNGSSGMDPVELYKVGEAYFVVDGNHRVSIARREGLKFIDAHVIEFRSDIKLTPDIQPDDLIIKAEYAEFLETTEIMQSRPNVDLTVTACCQYDKLMQQIRVCQQVSFEGRGEMVPLRESAAVWYDTMYIPLAEAIRDRDLLHWFPGRTITDLYLWISENRSELEQDLGWEIQSNIAVTDSILSRNTGTASGTWSKARAITRYTDNLFKDILIPISGEPESWDALEQSMIIAKRENASLHGLHIVSTKEQMEGEEALAVQARFNRRCADAGIDGSLAIESGEITGKICERAIMNDLIVLKISHPPYGRLSSLRSPFRSIISRSSRPLLGVISHASKFEHALLAYDGSLRSREALFVATYLAEMWTIKLSVFTATEGGRIKPEVQDHVRRYLDIHEVQADYITAESDAMSNLKKTADEQKADLVLMGGYGGSAIHGMIIGSSLDHMLRESTVPLFICR